MRAKGKIFKNNPHQETVEEWDDLDGRPSKGAQKRQAERLKLLGEQLAKLPVKQIKALPLLDITKEALIELASITAHEAKRRHLQLLGKLMRHEDEAQITAALSHRQDARQQAQALRWVTRMLTQGDTAINEFVKQHQQAERHALRQLLLKIKREQELQNTVAQTALAQQLQQYIQQMMLLSA